MNLLRHYAAKTNEYEVALSDVLDTDERLAEYAEAVERLRDEAKAADCKLQGAVALLHRALPYLVDLDEMLDGEGPGLLARAIEAEFPTAPGGQ